MARLRLPFRIPFFRIFYSTTYTSLFLIELVLLAVSPTTLIYEAITKEAFQYIIIIGGVYILVALFVIFIYTSRLYTNRIVLAAVGKSWIPIEEGEVSRSVRKLIKGQLERSALIALECRPRDLSATEDDLFGDLEVNDGKEVGKLVKVDPTRPPWGFVRHEGWSSPDPRETAVTPFVQFGQIIDELPNLLEARIVGLGGSPRTEERGDTGRTNLLEPRDYLERLDENGEVEIPESADHFLDLYETARFSGRPISEVGFITLTSAFADLLSGLGANPDHQETVLSNGHARETSAPTLDTIPDDASSSTSSMTDTSMASDSDSTATARRTVDVTPSASRRPSMPTGTRPHGRTGSVVRKQSVASSLSSRRVTRQGSVASLQSARSIIQQARESRRPSTNR